MMTVEVLGPFFLGSKRSLKTKNSEEKANFLVKKRFWLFILVISNMTNVREHFVRVHMVF